MLLLGGCHVPSSTAMKGEGGRTEYNKTLQQTSKEQMLLNIVRLRYFDTPYFVDVGNVTTQYTYKTSVRPSFPIPGFSEKNPAKIDGELSWQNQPTIQYSPLQGKAYTNQLLHPIDLRAIQQLCYSGWAIDRVFALIVQGFGGLLNAPEASGPMPSTITSYDDFFEAARLLRHFQKLGELQIGINVVKCSKENDEGDVQTQRLQLSFPKVGPEAERLNQIFHGLKHVNNRYLLSLQLGFDKKGKIGILPRSVLSCLYYLSQGIKVPTQDIEKERAAGCLSEPFDPGLIKIHCSNKVPCNSYISVKYRNKWFYIHDRDPESKKTFVLLMQLYNIQGGAFIQPPPLLTLPLG